MKKKTDSKAPVQGGGVVVIPVRPGQEILGSLSLTKAWLQMVRERLDWAEQGLADIERRLRAEGLVEFQEAPRNGWTPPPKIEGPTACVEVSKIQ